MAGSRLMPGGGRQSMDQVDNILAEIQALRPVQATPGVREQMLNHAHKLVAALETPSEFIARSGWAEPARTACLRTALHLNILDELSKATEKGIGITAIAAATGGEIRLVDRMLRHLAAMNIVSEVAQDQFAATDLSIALTEPRYRDGVIFLHDVALPAFQQMPTFLEASGFKEPLTPLNGPFQYGLKTDLQFWAWLNANPKYVQAFANYMAGYRASKLSWTHPHLYPVRKLLLPGVEQDDVLLVDCGGGKGHDLIEFQAAFPDAKGKLVLLEKPEVISQIEKPLPAGIEARPHDLFVEQPIKGARAYYLHSVLHGYDDENSVKILSQLRSAMTPGFSKLLVNDLVVPNTGATWPVTSEDVLMMVLGSVRERTEADFEIIFKAAGFKIDKIWTVDQGTESLIEAVAN